MTSASDDRESVDRAFAELVSQYHLTADRPEPPLDRAEPVAPGPKPATDAGWADAHPLFRTADRPAPLEEDDEPAADRFVPGPPPPLPRPAWPVLVAWSGIGFAALVVLGATFGLPLPTWIGGVAWLGFVGGFFLLVVRLPRHRPPEAGDGAVL